VNPPLPSVPSLGVLGTPLHATTYAVLTKELQILSRQPQPFAVDFTNTHIVTLRRRDPKFRAVTSRFDYFIPDGMPLVWCLNLQDAKLRDRVYGPTFMRHCVLASPAPFTHYLLGGGPDCVVRLKQALTDQNPGVNVVGARHGYFDPQEETAIVEEINCLSPDFVWVGLGTPKQHEWIHRNKSRLKRGILLAVGFAFDVNAGTKPDAPVWMQRIGLTWAYRLTSEPFRLGPRYLRFNCLFLSYVLWDGLRGRLWQKNLD
jgi:N-acetylglucosaminyldiphosphoundecaprenol N-acetyl-beta-D-mannosaminyltransferase